MSSPSYEEADGEAPIAAALERFRSALTTTTEDGEPLGSDRELWNNVLRLLSCLQKHPASRRLGIDGRPLSDRDRNLSHAIQQYIDDDSSSSPPHDRARLFADRIVADDTLPADDIWGLVVELVAVEPRPSPTPQPPRQTPWKQSSRSYPNSNDHRIHTDSIHRRLLDNHVVDITGLQSKLFGRDDWLPHAAEDTWKRCNNRLYKKEAGWTGWPENAAERDVGSFLNDIYNKVGAIAAKLGPTRARPRTLLTRPDRPIQGSRAVRKLDVAVVDMQAEPYAWKQVRVPGELKSNRSADTASRAWSDLARYAHEVLEAEAKLRYCVGFTLCGSLFRLWMFDRGGAVASDSFDINKDGRRFVHMLLAFQWSDEEALGFDPTILTREEDEQDFLEILRHGQKERLNLEQVIWRASGIAGRATTCWKAHVQGSPGTKLVVKDSWANANHPVEGHFLLWAAERRVPHVGEYYHHETVQVGGKDDDIQGNVRGGLTTGSGAPDDQPRLPSPFAGAAAAGGSRGGGRRTPKRSSSETGAQLPPSKQSRPSSPTKHGYADNRVHRRVITVGHGKPIYEASSHGVLATALRHCIEGHRRLLKDAGILHRDISTNNLLVNEDDKDRPAGYVIDFDLSIFVNRQKASGAEGKTGTKAFMAIGALKGEEHGFRHDLESFFWVLFWVCVHYEGPGESRVVPTYEEWNYKEMGSLAVTKTGIISEDEDFAEIVSRDFSVYYCPWADCVKALRDVVFPGGKRLKKDDEAVYEQMMEVLKSAPGGEVGVNESGDDESQ